MEKLSIGLNENERKKIAEILSTTLATTYAIYLKTQNYHWNVEGKEFYSVHIMLEKQYEELASAVDEIAERIRILGFYSEAAFNAFAKASLIKCEEMKRSFSDMIEILLSDHEKIICFLHEHLPSIEEIHDSVTVDLMNKRLATHEKVVWMLRSHL